ncbi:hypothetical protein ABW19_dt0204922 [Dactylella cylindrospora]|nr:hypothetical protein ABW19_dt0204922 [Dactylella cylindrospora]
MLLPRSPSPLPQHITTKVIPEDTLKDIVSESISKELENIGIAVSDDEKTQDPDDDGGDLKVEGETKRNILLNREADATATPMALATSDPGQISAHKLEDAYPSRPTPIKADAGKGKDRDESGDGVGTTSPEDGESEAEEGDENGVWDQDVATLGDDSSTPKDESGLFTIANGKDDDNGEEDGIIEIDMAPMMPLGGILDLEEPHQPQGDEGILEIEMLPGGGVSMEMTGGDPDNPTPHPGGLSDLFNLGDSSIPNTGNKPPTGNNDIVEEIWISTSGAPAPIPTPTDRNGGHGEDFDFDASLDKFAGKMQEVLEGMVGMFDAPIPSETPVSQLQVQQQQQPQPQVTGVMDIDHDVGDGVGGDSFRIDSAMWPGGSPTVGGTGTVSGATATVTEVVKVEAGGAGKVVGIVVLAVIVPIIAVTALGCCLTACVRKVKNRKGYKEVQERLTADEEWN